MKWIMLLTAGILEVTWACAMKYSNGFTQPLPSVITAVGYIASAVFLSLAMKELPLGSAYAMWTGFGIVGTTILSVFLFDERLNLIQIIFVVMIIIGIAGLKIFQTK